MKKREKKQLDKLDLKVEKKKYKPVEDSDLKGGSWGQDEIQRFIDAVMLYKKDFKSIEKHVGTRSRAQIGSYMQ